MIPNQKMIVGAAALTLTGLICVPAQVANADGAQPTQGATAIPAGAPDTGSAGGELQEVVVTAERRSTDAQQTPISVTALSGDQLQALHLNNLVSLQTTVPSMQVGDQGGLYDTINIRGVGNTGSSSAVLPGVAVIRDGVLLSETLGINWEMFDVADVEVLEGPQGTFVGSSSEGGAVEINSANPNLTSFGGYVQGSLATYSDTKWQGALNLPISDTLAVRFAFNDDQRDSFYKDVGTPGSDPGSIDDRQVRVKVLWKPTDNFQALADVEYNYMSTGGTAEEPTPGVYNTLFSYKPGGGGCTSVTGTSFTGTQLSCPLPGTPQHSTYWYPGETPLVLDYYGNTQQNQLQTLYSLDLRYTMDDGIALRSLSAFVHNDITAVISPSYGPQNAGQEYHVVGPNDNYMSQEIDLISPTIGRFNWIAGAFWDYRNSPASSYTTSVKSPYEPDELPSTVSLTQSPSTNRMAAVFGQTNWQFTDTLQLQVGVRENWDNNFSSDTTNVAPARGTTLLEPNGTGVYSINYTNGEPSSYTVLSQESATGAFKDSVTTGKVDLGWTPMPGENFYVFYARGYKAGGVNSSSTDYPLFAPEYDNDFEAGWKGRLFDGHMLTQVALYYNIYKNMQYTLYDTEANNDSSTGAYVANLAPSKIYGLEASEQARFGGLGVNAGVAYTHSALGAVTTFPSYALPPGFGSPTTLPQCVPGHTYAAKTECFDYTPYMVNVSGEENPYAPTFTANISTDYVIRVGNGTLDPRVTFSHMNKQYSSIFEVPYSLMQARNLLGASIDWVEGPWDTQLYGTNLTNQIYVVGVGTGGSYTFYGDPRQAGIQVTRHF